MRLLGIRETVQDGVALVTGGGRGIGRECALALAERGLRVVVSDIGSAVDGRSIEDAGVASDVAEEILAKGGEAVSDTSDVTDHAAVGELIAGMWDRWGRLDVLVNAAGIIRDRMIWNVTSDEWQQVVAVHLQGPFNTTHHLARLVREHEPSGGATVVNFSSSAGVFGNIGSSSYGAAKAGVVGLTRVTAMELARYDVSANCVVPFAWTRMADELAPSGDRGGRIERLQQLSPTPISQLICHLADGGRSVTGQVIGVRGRELFVMRQPTVAARFVASAGDSPDYEGFLELMSDEMEPIRSGPDVFDYEPFV